MEEIKDEGKFLPIGSVVLLNNGTKKVMITGFCLIPNNEEIIYDYSGCMYPEGILNSSQVFLFNHDQISKIFFLGYSSEEETLFKEHLKQKVEEYKKNDISVDNNATSSNIEAL